VTDWALTALSAQTGYLVPVDKCVAGKNSEINAVKVDNVTCWAYIQ